jgi:hypothetical protein
MLSPSSEDAHISLDTVCAPSALAKTLIKQIATIADLSNFILQPTNSLDGMILCSYSQLLNSPFGLQNKPNTFLALTL